MCVDVDVRADVLVMVCEMMLEVVVTMMRKVQRYIAHPLF